jgi:hypothetical protein
MEKLKQVLLRILAAFAASGLGVVGAGTIAGVPLWKAIMMAGIGGVATVVERLARLYLDDGNLSTEDINAAFGVINQGAPAAEAPAVVEEESTVVAKKG